MRITAFSCAVLLSGAGLLIAGCSNAASSGAASSAGTPARRALAPAPVPAAGLGQHGFGAQAPSLAAQVVPTSESIIYTANITLRVTDAAKAAAGAMTYVTGLGGYTASEHASLSPSAAQRQSVSLTLKVPVADYATALNRLASLGRQTALSQQSSDVTQEVADVNSRVTSEQDAIAQLRTLLRRAGTVTGLLQVQQQIAGDESSLEALQAQQRALDHETSYATIAALLVGPRPRHVARHHHAAHRGFVAGLGSGWRGLRHATTWVLTALGAILPFLGAVAILAALGYAAWRRLARRRSAPRPASGDAS